MSVGDRLGRLLFMVPYVASRDGVPLKELAQTLGVGPAQIEADLNLLSMVGRPPLTPDHLIDMYVEDDVVYVDLDQSLSRPLQLTHEEARALVLGAKLVGPLGGLGEQLEAVLERIIERLAPAEQELVRSLTKRIGLWQDGAESVQPAAELRRAIDAHREVRVDYYSASSDRQKTYRLQPLAIINHSGAEYLVALDVEAEKHEKLFRLDRMAAVAVTDATFAADAEVDLEKYRTPNLYQGEDGTRALVRFAPQVARQVRERFADKGVVERDDGSVEVSLATSSPAWLARWVLPFGLDAEIVGPPQQRRQIGALCRDAAAAYAKDIAPENG